MKKYKKPVSCDMLSLNSRDIVPALAGMVAGAAVAKVISKAVDTMFDSKLFSNNLKLDNACMIQVEG